MMRKFNLDGRFGLLILVPIVLLISIGSVGWWNATSLGSGLLKLQSYHNTQHQLRPLADMIGNDLNRIAHAATLGQLGWEPALQQLGSVHDRFEARWQQYINALPAAERSAVDTRYRPALIEVRRAFSELSRLLASRDRAQLRLFTLNEFDALITPYLTAVNHQIQQQHTAAAALEQTLNTARQQRSLLAWGLLLIALLGITALGLAVRQSIMQPIRRIDSVARAVAIGDYNVRVGFGGRDELGKLGQALDRLLDDQQTFQTKAREQRAELQAAMDAMQESLRTLEHGDFSSRLPTDEEFTRPLAQALNRLIERLAANWQPISTLSSQVDEQAQTLEFMVMDLNRINADDLNQVNALSTLADALETAQRQTAKRLQACRLVSEDAQRNTQAALQALQQVVAATPKTPLEPLMREGLEKLQTQATAIQALVADFIDATAQAHTLAINSDLNLSEQGIAHSANSELHSLARALHRAEQLLTPLSQRVHNEASTLLKTVQQRLAESPAGVSLTSSLERLHNGHEAVVKLVTVMDKMNNDVQNQTQSTSQLLVYSAQLHALSEQVQALLHGQLDQTKGLTQSVQQLQALIPASKSLGTSESESESEHPDSHAPLTMYPA